MKKIATLALFTSAIGFAALQPAYAAKKLTTDGLTNCQKCVTAFTECNSTCLKSGVTYNVCVEGCRKTLDTCADKSCR